MDESIIIPTIIQEVAPVLISAIVAWLAWLVRRYVRSLGDEKKLATIVQVANAAVDYAEDLDKRGDLQKILSSLNVSKEVIDSTSRGVKKLHIAGQFVEDELNRMGIELSGEEAQKWVASEFQKRLTGLNLTTEQLVQIQGLLGLIQNLDQEKVNLLLANQAPAKATRAVEIPQPVEPVPQPKIPEEPQAPPGSESEPSFDNELRALAQQAVDYVSTLKKQHELNIPELDIATAWMLTEVTKRGYNVTPNQVAREIHQAFE